MSSFLFSTILPRSPGLSLPGAGAVSAVFTTLPSGPYEQLNCLADLSSPFRFTTCVSVHWYDIRFCLLVARFALIAATRAAVSFAAGAAAGGVVAGCSAAVVSGLSLIH